MISFWNEKEDDEMAKISRRTMLGAVGASMVAATALGRAGAQAKSAHTYKLEREIPIEQGYDLVVAGGGPAGAAAAICAARLGVRVLLVEATGCLGGMGTSGLVTAFDPMSDGQRTLVAGFMNEVVTTLYKRGFLGPKVTPKIWESSYMTWTPFNVEGYKLILDEFATAAHVEIRYFTRVIDADVSPNGSAVQGVVLNNVEGYRFVRAKAFIDATGDAVLANLCGVKCREAGKDSPRIMPATLAMLFAGIDFAKFPKAKEHDYLLKALANGEFKQIDRLLPGMSQVNETVGYLNGGHIFNLNALRTQSLSDGMMLGRRIAQEFLKFYRKDLPGCENIELVTTASLMGVRESRRIVGEYELTEHDYLGRRQFPDQIGVFNKFIDIHPYDTSLAEWERFQQESNRTGRLNQGECFGIPYGILVPKASKNLWVAGRCASSDVQVHGSIRVQPAASMMGQAAGTAAVQSIQTGQPACDLDTASLIKTLREHGAYLPQDRVSKTMTRANG
jgi:hypothetical protein